MVKSETGYVLKYKKKYWGLIPEDDEMGWTTIDDALVIYEEECTTNPESMMNTFNLGLEEAKKGKFIKIKKTTTVTYEMLLL